MATYREAVTRARGEIRGDIKPYKPWMACPVLPRDEMLDTWQISIV